MCRFTLSIHTLCLSVGGRMDGWMDGRTDARKNIYSIFRDKLLLLGEHGYIPIPKQGSPNQFGDCSVTNQKRFGVLSNLGL